MTEWAIGREKQRSTAALRIADIGTGSGCIAVALAKRLPGAAVYGVDVSEEALEVARINGRNNRVDVQWIRCDILDESTDKIPALLDVIISNPPYVTVSEKKDMQANVLDYEPHVALFVPDDRPLLFYDRIADIGIRCLTPGGRLYFEINAAFGPAIRKMLAEKGYRDIRLKQDISGHDRMISAIR
jgi:release factor glutamine methyltransferase